MAVQLFAHRPELRRMDKRSVHRLAILLKSEVRVELTKVLT